MIKNWMRPATCCFTGHREIPTEKIPEIEESLEVAVRKLIGQGVTRFLCGGARGFDMMAGQLLIRLKREIPGLELFLILPCRGQEKNWSMEDILQYEGLRRRADRVVYLEEAYTDGCMHRRNRAMVDSSSYCIYYQVKDTGGTAYTVDYAVRKGLKLIPVCPLGDEAFGGQLHW